MQERLNKLYRSRFNPEEIKKKNRLWKVLCREFFQKYIPENASVLDIGAGYCEFINNIKAGTKYAVDLNPDTIRFAGSDVKVVICRADQLDFLADGSVDVVFMSNFLEHLDTKNEVLVILKEAHRALKPGGRILVLLPNIRYVYKKYWDYFDHKLPLSDKSLAEALEITDFKIIKSYSRFLPYSTKSRLPWNELLIKIYLKIPLAWYIMGAQAFIVGIK
jgi:SAM-dependent methyltransferase